MSLSPAAAKSSPVQEVTTPVAACDGGAGQLGHPRIFLTFDHGAEVTCPYCSQVFRLAAGVKTGHGH